MNIPDKRNAAGQSGASNIVSLGKYKEKPKSYRSKNQSIPLKQPSDNLLLSWGRVTCLAGIFEQEQSFACLQALEAAKADFHRLFIEDI